MLLHRKIEVFIRRWIKSGKEPLLIDGARKVGKTYTIRKILQDEGCQYAEFNLLEHPSLMNLLIKSETAEDIIANLSLFTNQKIIKGKTILYFDEIQEFHELAPKIELIVKDNGFRYLFSGCFYGEALQSLRSVPARDIKVLKMYPLDFEDFLQIYQFGPKQKQALYRSFRDQTPVSESTHLRMLHLFRTYLYVGGMPSVVEVFQNTRSPECAMEEQKKILHYYYTHLTDTGRGLKRSYLSEIFRLIPVELDQHNKRFHFSDITKGLRFDRNGTSFQHICEMGIAVPVYHISSLRVPLILTEKRTLFKLFLTDVGLLTMLYGREIKDQIIAEHTDVCNGAIYENAVVQNLIAHGFELHYFNTKQHGELDLVVETRGRALPVQVKIGKTYHRHSALIHVPEISDGTVTESILFSDLNVRKDKNVIRYPIYMIMFLSRV